MTISYRVRLLILFHGFSVIFWITVRRDVCSSSKRFLFCQGRNEECRTWTIIGKWQIDTKDRNENKNERGVVGNVPLGSRHYVNVPDVSSCDEFSRLTSAALDRNNERWLRVYLTKTFPFVSWFQRKVCFIRYDHTVLEFRLRSDILNNMEKF